MATRSHHNLNSQTLSFVFTNNNFTTPQTQIFIDNAHDSFTNSYNTKSPSTTAMVAAQTHPLVFFQSSKANKLQLHSSLMS
jgi:hypothetical protein